MKRKTNTVSGKLLLAYLEGICGLSVRFSKYSEQNVPFDALLRRRLQNRSSEVVASFKTTREIMPHPVAHAHKLLLVLRRRRPLGSHRFVSSLLSLFRHQPKSWRSGTKKCSACVKSVALDKATRTLGTRFVLALKKAVFYRCGVCTVLLFCRRLRKKFMDVLLSSLRHSSRQNLHAAKCELSSFVTVFSVFRFPFSPLFFQHEWKPGRRWRPKHQTERAGNSCCSWWWWLSSKHLTNHAFNT